MYIVITKVGGSFMRHDIKTINDWTLFIKVYENIEWSILISPDPQGPPVLAEYMGGVIRFRNPEKSPHKPLFQD